MDKSHIILLSITSKHFKYNIPRKNIPNFMMVKVVKHINIIVLMQSFMKTNFRLCLFNAGVLPEIHTKDIGHTDLREIRCPKQLYFPICLRTMPQRDPCSISLLHMYYCLIVLKL